MARLLDYRSGQTKLEDIIMKTQLKAYRKVGQPDFLIRRIGFLFVLMIAFSNYSAAESRAWSTLELSIWNNRAFEVIIDDRIYRGHQVVRINDLRPGRHTIQVRQRMQNSYGHGGGGVRTLYDGRIDIPARRRLKASIDRNRRLCVLQSIPNHQVPMVQPSCSHSTVNCSCSAASDHGFHETRPVCGVNNELYPAYPSGGHDDHYYHDYKYGNNSGTNNSWETNSMTMGNQEFSALLAQLEDNFFDDQRMIIARQALIQRQISSVQAREILKSFNFESTRLEFAKFAYLKVYDPERFYVVNEVFSFSSSIRELDQYIASI